jgi:maleylacetoacetate isomerase
MTLYDYFRSSASYRVRIALALKGLSWTAVPVNLRAGAQHAADYRARNPAGLVPALETADGVLSQSLAIIEYLDEVHPEPRLLPQGAQARAEVRGFALAIACDIHPLNNLRVLQYLADPLGLDDDARNRWARHWIASGLAALEQRAQAHAADGPYCFGAAPGLADCCLVPQLFNARRVDCDLSPYPRLTAIEAACLALPAFAQAHPSRQSDAV